MGFATDAERDAALGLLNLPALCDRLSQLYDYLQRMGCTSAIAVSGVIACVFTSSAGTGQGNGPRSGSRGIRSSADQDGKATE